MILTLTWLKEFVDIDDVSVDELAYRLTMSGIESHSVKSVSVDKNVVVAKILSISKHPNADKLSLCEVTDGQINYRIVCGANNIKADDVVPLAKIGSKLPDGEIKKTKIRGIESEGMLCSPTELRIEGDASGIWILPKEVQIGLSLDDYLNRETFIETEITINRGDCLSVFGVAREISAIFNRKLKKEIKQFDVKRLNVFPVKIENTNGCLRYIGTVVKNVKVEKSPQWLISRLENCGLHSVNNVVDITNYILLEYGQPLHAFDCDKLKDKIVVRNAKSGEKIFALDNKEYMLDDEMLVIADEQEPLAIAGVIGGRSTAVSESTKNIFLEAACFEPVSTRKTSKKLPLSTESSQRFIRGIDIMNIPNIAMLAANMIKEICGGEIVDGIVDLYPNQQQPIKIELDTNKVNKVLGTAISLDEIKDILSRLGFPLHLPSSIFHLSVTVPSHRNDIREEVDLIEEIARIYGYNNIKTSDKISYSMSNANTNKTEQVIDKIKAVAIKAGFFETINYNFISKDTLFKFRLTESNWEIKNPISQEEPFLTTSLIPLVVKNASRNFNHGKKNVKLFEIGKVFLDTEKTFFAGCVSGCQTGWWKEKPTVVNFYFLKGFIEALFYEIGVLDFKFEKSNSETFSKNESAAISISGKTVGDVGLISSDIKNKLDIKNDLYAFEMNLNEVVDFVDSDKKYIPIPKFPSMERDIAIEVSQNFNSKQITDVIRQVGGDVLSCVSLFDFYAGEQIKEGYKSLAFRLTFRRQDRTLKDEEISVVMKKVVSQLEWKFKAKIR